jgi:hypothetical protein
VGLGVCPTLANNLDMATATASAARPVIEGNQREVDRSLPLPKTTCCIPLPASEQGS